MRTRLPGVGLGLALLLLAGTAGAKAAAIDVPAGLDFYSPPPLPANEKPGTLIWSRPLSGGSALRSAAANYVLLYSTIAADGKPVAVSGTLAIPPGAAPKGGWPVLSWAHGTTGDAPQCAPSRGDHANGEQRMLNAWVSKGYAVAQTDYEGEATPGVHPYFVAESTARDVTDIVRASRQLEPSLGTKWVVMGHSEGGAGALSTAAFGPAWAPELSLVGAVAYAPGSHLAAWLEGQASNEEPSLDLPMLGYLIEGFAAADPQIVLSRVLSPAGMQLLPLLQQRCIFELMIDSPWVHVAPKSIFQPGTDFSKLQSDLRANDPGALRIDVPTLLLQGTADELVAPLMTQDLKRQLCSRSAPLFYREYPGATHNTVLALSEAEAMPWVAQRFAGAPAQTNCV